MRGPLAIMFAGGLALFLPGCTTGEVVPAGSRFLVTATRAQFYKYGPAQSFGADFALGQGQKVTMIEKSFGFSRVMTSEGITGYVASDDIAPAPPEPKATPPPKPRRPGSSGSGSSGGGGWFSGKPKRSDVRGTPGSPLFDVNDVPTPLPEGPTGTPKPAPPFRF